MRSWGFVLEEAQSKGLSWRAEDLARAEVLEVSEGWAPPARTQNAVNTAARE